MKFCFFGEISGALMGKTIGGGELQIALLAKALALKGHEISIIDPSISESHITLEGIKVLAVPNWNKGLRGIRMFLYRIPALWKIFLEQKADYYYVRMKSFFHLIPYIAAKRTGGKFIQAIASDIDLLSFGEKFKYQYKGGFKLFDFLTVYMPNVCAFNFLLTKSDYVILQHSGQEVNKASIKGKIAIFPNIIDYNNLPVGNNTSKEYFIYVGSLSILKGADKLLQLINILDKRNTIMIVGQPNDSRSKTIVAQLNKINNVIVKGRLNHKETLQLIANAKAVINTSNYEGFPNIFLESWAMKIPVISLSVNPGDIFNKYDLGVCCEGDLNKMKSIIESNKTANTNIDNFMAYINKFHDFNTAGDRFLNTISDEDLSITIIESY